MLTDDERAVIMALADVWNLYTKLPTDHAWEAQEFMHGIHALQSIVAARPAFRKLKETGLTSG